MNMQLGNMFDIFVYDALCDSSLRVPFVHPQELRAEAIYPSISDDGTTVAFVSRDENINTQIWVYHIPTDTLEIATIDEQGEPVLGFAEGPRVSADGHFVAFHTRDPLVAEDTNELIDVYVFDRQQRRVERVSLNEHNLQAEVWGAVWPSISGDGRYVVFETANAMVDGVSAGPQIYLRDRQEETTRLVSALDAASSRGQHARASISASGRFVVWQTAVDDLVPDDENGVTDVFIRDLELETIERVSVDDQGGELALPAELPRISADGDTVLFQLGYLGGNTDATQVWAKDRATGALTLLSRSSAGEPASHDVVNAALSADGRWAAFETRATNLVPEGNPGGGWRAYMVMVP